VYTFSTDDLKYVLKLILKKKYFSVFRITTECLRGREANLTVNTPLRVSPSIRTDAKPVYTTGVCVSRCRVESPSTPGRPDMPTNTNYGCYRSVLDPVSRFVAGENPTALGSAAARQVHYSPSGLVYVVHAQL